MTSHEETRLQRLHIIKRSIESSKNPDMERLIAQCSMEWGASRRTILEYIKVVQKAYGK